MTEKKEKGLEQLTIGESHRARVNEVDVHQKNDPREERKEMTTSVVLIRPRH